MLYYFYVGYFYPTFLFYMFANWKNIVKILLLIGTIVQTLMGVVGGMIPADVSIVINALVAAIFAFVSKIPTSTTPE